MSSARKYEVFFVFVAAVVAGASAIRPFAFASL
jgi:hypothetical protein